MLKKKWLFRLVLAGALAVPCLASATTSDLLRRVEDGQELQRRMDLSGASAIFDEVLAKEPANVEVITIRALVYQSQGKYELALSELDRALAIDRGHARALGNRGHLCLAMGRYAQAVTDSDRSLNLEPGNAAVWNNRGMAWWALDRPGKAIEDYSRALQLDDGFVAALVNRAVAYRALGREDVAAVDQARAEGLGWRNKPGQVVLPGRGAMDSFEVSGR